MSSWTGLKALNTHLQKSSSFYYPFHSAKELMYYCFYCAGRYIKGFLGYGVSFGDLTESSL